MRVGEAAVGPELAVFAYVRVAEEEGLRPDYAVTADGGVWANPSLRGVNKGDAAGHEASVNAVARDGRELGELGAAVDAETLGVVVYVQCGDALAVRAQDFYHVGEVVLALGVVVADLADMGGKRRAVEGIATGVALEQRGRLLGRAISLFDVAQHGTGVVELKAAVAEGIGRRHGKDGCRSGAICDASCEARNGLRPDEWQVCVEHDNGTIVDAGGLKCDAHGVAGAEALGLVDALDARPLTLRVGGVDDGAHLVGVAAHDDDDAVASAGEGSVDHPANHGLAENLVRDLGVARLHARALASSEDDGGCGAGHGVTPHGAAPLRVGCAASKGCASPCRGGNGAACRGRSYDSAALWGVCFCGLRDRVLRSACCRLHTCVAACARVSFCSWLCAGTLPSCLRGAGVSSRG